MIRVGIDCDELYPAYFLEEDMEDVFGTPVDVDPEQLARWRSAWEAFAQVQREMEETYNAASEKVDAEVVELLQVVRLPPGNLSHTVTHVDEKTGTFRLTARNDS